MKTQGEIEAAVCAGIVRFEQEYMGRGPKDIRTHLIEDLLGDPPVWRFDRGRTASRPGRCQPRREEICSSKFGPI